MLIIGVYVLIAKYRQMYKYNIMNIIMYTLLILIPLLGNSQAHIGSTLSDIKSFHPDKVFKIDYTDTGIMYASANMHFGTFVYYFDSETGLSKFCIQIPDNMASLNAQVEVYNNKYVIISETSWKAYLEGGGVMEINLTYNEEYKLYVFYYKN